MKKSESESKIESLIPLHEYVLVVRDEAPKEIGGIALPESARQNWKMRSGEVVAVGPGRWEKGFRKPISREIVPGAKVLFGENAGVEILEDPHLFAMTEDEIYVVVSHGKAP